MTCGCCSSYAAPISGNEDAKVINEEIAGVAFQTIKVLRNLTENFLLTPIWAHKGDTPSKGPYKLDIKICSSAPRGGDSGKVTIFHDGPNRYRTVYEKCYLGNPSITSDSKTYVSGMVSSNNLKGSSLKNETQTAQYTDVKFEGVEGVLTINGTMDIYQRTLPGPANLHIRFEHKTSFPGSTQPVTDIHVRQAQLTYSQRSSSNPHGETSAKIRILTNRDDDELQIETLEPLLDLEHVPTAGVIKISEISAKSRGIVTIEDRDISDASNWVVVNVDYDGDGSLGGEFDQQITQELQWDNFNFK